MFVHVLDLKNWSSLKFIQIIICYKAPDLLYTFVMPCHNFNVATLIFDTMFPKNMDLDLDSDCLDVCVLP